MAKIKEVFNPDKLFFTSDTHFGHVNIIKYCDRPFVDNEEMTNTLIDNWNMVVPKDGTVFHLGDFALCSTGYCQGIMSQLNGNLYLIVGNHEKTVLKPKHLRDRFVQLADILEIKVVDQELGPEYAYIVMCHYPMLSWNHSYHGSWHLYGHVHGTLNHPNPNALEVGVDPNEFTPLSYLEVKTRITKQNLNKT
jgi:calcineurin-like phosphoesterase family protein